MSWGVVVMCMEPKLFIATKAIVIHNGRVLLLRESESYEDGTNTGRYDLPGGRLKSGERFDEALLREILEETGLRVKIMKVVTVSEWRPVVRGEQWQIVGIFFECHSHSSEVRVGSDHDAYEWIDPIEYLKYGIIENLKPVFAEYLRQRKEI